jgi:hypothetical protein
MPYGNANVHDLTQASYSIFSVGIEAEVFRIRILVQTPICSGLDRIKTCFIFHSLFASQFAFAVRRQAFSLTHPLNNTRQRSLLSSSVRLRFSSSATGTYTHTVQKHKVSLAFKLRLNFDLDLELKITACFTTFIIVTSADLFTGNLKALPKFRDTFRKKLD